MIMNDRNARGNKQQQQPRPKHIIHTIQLALINSLIDHQSGDRIDGLHCVALHSFIGDFYLLSVDLENTTNDFDLQTQET